MEISLGQPNYMSDTSNALLAVFTVSSALTEGHISIQDLRSLLSNQFSINFLFLIITICFSEGLSKYMDVVQTTLIHHLF